MRAPIFRGWSLLPGEMIADNFAGGGGTSCGIEPAMGRPADIAINHSAKAIAMHKANHPDTKHFCENILDVDPREACGGRPVGLAWFSPDCTHFSRAKGSKPLKKETRALANVVIRWAREVKPRIIILENVEEFQTWGPLDENDRPIKERMGETFREWLAALAGAGYAIDHRTLVAADYGTPTTRKRFFLVARCDGRPIIWPDRTHGEGRPISWRAAAEIIDWSLPCPSIFDRQRPLAEATMKRIAAGIQRYVIGAAQPFVMAVTHHNTGHARGADEPLKTVTAAHRGELAVVDPFVIRTKTWGGGGNGARPAEDPLRTITASKRGDMAIVEPFIVRHGHVSSITGLGDTMRGQQLGKPLATVCATNDKHLVAPIITKHNAGGHGGAIGGPVTRTLGTVTGRDQHALSAAWLTKYYATSRAGSGMDAPMPTATAKARMALSAAFLMKYHGGARGAGRGQLPDQPIRTLDTSNRFAEVRAFMTKFYGTSTGAPLQLPFPTVTTGGNRGGGHLGLVMIAGEPYEISDIGMRMLQPHELFAAQGFPDDYEIAPWFNGKPLTKTDQTALAGNSVCPQVAEALITANARAA